MTLAKMIKRLRADRQLTQIQLAKKTHLTQPMIAMLETGAVTNVTLATLRRLAKALSVTPSDLLR